MRDALRVYEKLGAKLVEVSLPNLPLSVPTYYVVAPAECSSNLSRFDGVRFGHRCENPKDLLDLYKRSRGEGFGAEVKRRIMTGTYVLSAGYYDAYYLQAQKVRRLITDDFARAFKQVDVLMGPTSPTPAFDLGAKIDDPITMYLNDIYTIGANLAGLPAMSIPCGLPRRLAGRAADHRAALRRGEAAQRRARLSARDATGTSRFRRVTRSSAMSWETVIGLEIHAQLATRSKIFSSAPTAYGAAPNTQANLVDLGYPGVLPVLNREAVRMAVKFGLAVGAHGRAALGVRAQELLLSGPAEGLPDQPVRAADRGEGHGCEIVLDDGARKTIGITRAHLEEDAGKSLHEDFQGQSGIDLNRAGTPLLEIVSEPDMRSAKEAVAYMKKIHTLVRYLEICDGNMQEGSFRCDANVSVRPVGAGEVRHALRDQEPELVPLHREGDQLRGRAADRDDRGRRQDPAGDAPVRSGQGRDARAALQGRGERLPLLPRSGPAAGRARRRVHRSPCARRCRSCRTRRPRATSRSSACRSTTPAC